jgi:hypothetical protein
MVAVVGVEEEFVIDTSSKKKLLLNVESVTAMNSRLTVLPE